MRSCNRFIGLACVLVFMSITHTATAAAPLREITIETGVEYSNPDDQHLAMNIALPQESTGLRPAILCIHGGGFRAGKRESYDGLCKQLAERGYVAATTSYRLAPKFRFPAAIHDVKAAVRFLRANAQKYQIDPDKIGVVGGSAGGHLAQFLGVTGEVAQFEGEGGHPGVSSRVSCVVNFYGPSDFTKSYGKSVDAAEVLPLWFGGDLQSELHQHQLGSPLNWVTPEAAPTLLIHGTEDKYVAFEQAEWMHTRLQQVGVEVELLRLEGAGHGFKDADADKANAAMFEFFDQHYRRATSNE
jgi:acetyl esterase/lipase